MNKAGRRVLRSLPQNPLLRHIQNRVTPLVLLVVTLLLSLLLSILTSYFVTNQQRARFEREADLFDSLLLRRMETYQGTLYSVRALWTSDLNINAQSFRNYTLTLDLSQRYPGVLGMGFMRWVPQAQQASFEREMRREVPSYTVRPSIQGVGTPIMYIEPGENFVDALGVNIYTSLPRREAIQRAIRTGTPQMTSALSLLHLQQRPQRGVILMLSVQRDSQLYGLAYLPVSLAQLFSSLEQDKGASGQAMPGAAGRLNIEVFDGSERLYGVAQPHGVFVAERRLSIAGQVWTMRYSASEAFGRDAASNLPMAVLLLGMLVALAAYFSYLAQTHARLHAEQVSESLRVSRGKLERSRAEFESIFRSMADSAVFTDLSGRILFANSALSQRFGYDMQQLRAQPVSLLRADTRLQQLLGSAASAALSTVYTTRSGEQFYGELQRTLVVSETGQKLGYLEVVHDLSSRRATEQALQSSEQRYRGVLESMPQMVWLTSVSGQHTYFNQRWQEYVGPEVTDTLLAGAGSAALGGLLHPDDRDEFLRRWHSAHLTGQPFEMEHRLLSASQSYRTFMTRSEAVRASSGEVLEWVSAATDIDDQVFSEQSSRLLASVSKLLSGSERLPGEALGIASLPDNASLRATLRLINERLSVFSAIWTASAPAEVPPADTAVLQSAVPLTARSALSQVRGHVRETALLTLPEVLRTLGQARVLAEPVMLEDPVLQAGGLSGLVVTLLAPERRGSDTVGSGLGASGAASHAATYHPATYLVLGVRQPVRVRELEVVQELASRVVAYLESARLAQEVRDSQVALQELNASLEQRVAERTAALAAANHELETFSYSVSHDLRAPLRHMTAFSELLQKELQKEARLRPDAEPNKKVERYLGIIMSSGQRMGQLIDDLLEFSRTSRQPLRLERVEVQKLILEVQTEAALTEPGSRAIWHIGEFPAVSADASLLRQVFVNLLSNAAKYSSKSPRPEIWVDGRVQGDELLISVRDNGVGFDPQYADKLFGVFQRLHRPEDFEGSGIGLANVRRIVERHGGRVWANAVLGEGATFWVSLRLYAEGEASVSPD